jgi:hypothetical protein
MNMHAKFLRLRNPLPASRIPIGCRRGEEGMVFVKILTFYFADYLQKYKSMCRTVAIVGKSS